MAAAANTDLDLYLRLNTELTSLVDHFTNMVKATREGLDAEAGDGGAMGRDRRVPGELLEVAVEKLLAAGHQCIHTVSQLKTGAMVSDFDALMANVHHVAYSLTNDTFLISRGLEHVRRDAETLLGELEQHYYSSAAGREAPRSGGGGGSGGEDDGGGGRLAELCELALQMTGG